MARLGMRLTALNTELINLMENDSKGGGGGGEGDEGEGQDSEDGDGSGEGDESDDDQDGSGKGGKGDDEGDEDGKSGGSDGGDDGDEGEGQDMDNRPEGSGDREDGWSGKGADDDSGPQKGRPQQGGQRTASGEMGTAGSTAGGDVDTQGYGSFAKDLVDAMQNSDPDGKFGLADNNSALKEAVVGATKSDAKGGEQMWRPHSSNHDSVVYAKEDRSSANAAKAMLDAVRPQVASITTGLRNKFLQANAKKDIHGVRKGRGLSERRLVNSVVELRSGVRPTRPDWNVVQRDVCSLAVSIVLDESGSMGHLAREVGKASMAVAEPLDKLGAPCLVVGPRGTGWYNSGYTNPAPDERGLFHRTSGVTIDIFKDWHEKMNLVRGRFGNVQAVGGTPLSDGIQYAMQELMERPERHRVVMVVTDGVPNCPEVVRWQIRKAAQAGIHIIGVGISDGCREVPNLFPEHVLVPNISELPRKLLKVLDGIMFPARGKRVALPYKFEGKLR